MKWLLVLSALLVLGTAEDLYSSENDDLDIEAVVNDPDTRKEYLECFTGKGPCRDKPAAFKKDIAEAVVQACAKCTKEQKHIFRRFLEVIKEKDPRGYEHFQQKYDPQDKYLTALEAAIANA